MAKQTHVFKNAHLRSFTEFLWAVFFNAFCDHWKYEPKPPIRLESGVRYSPDFLISIWGEEFLVEIKWKLANWLTGAWKYPEVASITGKSVLLIKGVPSWNQYFIRVFPYDGQDNNLSVFLSNRGLVLERSLKDSLTGKLDQAFQAVFAYQYPNDNWEAYKNALEKRV